MKTAVLLVVNTVTNSELHPVMYCWGWRGGEGGGGWDLKASFHIRIAIKINVLAQGKFTEHVQATSLHQTHNLPHTNETDVCKQQYQNIHLQIEWIK